MKPVVGALAFLIASAGGVCADDARAYEKAAMKGDYQAQRNWAYVLARGEGVSQNVVEACAWRIVIVATQHALVSETDVSRLDGDCANQQIADAAGLRARTLVKSVPSKRRSVKADLRDLSEGACPGADCAGTHGALVRHYSGGVAGDVPAMRELARCFATSCEQFAGHDLFQACVWSKRVMASLGDAATRDDRVRNTTTCGFLGPRANAAAERMIAEIGAMKRD